MTEWQPIETAPKDGTHILAYMENAVIEAWWEDTSYGNPEYEGRGEWECPNLSSHGCGCCSIFNDAPTHWMPLPHAPEAAS